MKLGNKYINKIKESKNIRLASSSFAILWKISRFIAKGLVVFCYEVLRDVVIALARLTKFLLVGFVNMFRGWKPMTEEQAFSNSFNNPYFNLNKLFADSDRAWWDSRTNPGFHYLYSNIHNERFR